MWYQAKYFYVMHIIMLFTHTSHKIYEYVSEHWGKQISIFHRKSIMNFGIFVEKSQCQPDSSTAQSLKVISLTFKFQFRHCYFTLVSYFYLFDVLLPLPSLLLLLLLLLRLLVILLHSKKNLFRQWVGHASTYTQHSSHIAHRTSHIARNSILTNVATNFHIPRPSCTNWCYTDNRHVCACVCVCACEFEKLLLTEIRFYIVLFFCCCHSGARVAKKKNRRRKVFEIGF